MMINRLTLLGIMMSGYYSKTAAAGSLTLLKKMRMNSVKAGPMLPLTREKFEVLTFRMELNIAVFNEYWDIGQVGYQGLYGDKVVYLEDSTGVDAVLLLDVGEYCFIT